MLKETKGNNIKNVWVTTTRRSLKMKPTERLKRCLHPVDLWCYVETL